VLSECRFTILTDHKPLVAFPKQTELLGRQARWPRIINQFICTIQYIDGYKNVIADAFSRVFINPEVLPTLSDFIPSKIDPPEPPASARIGTSTSPPAPSVNSLLHPPIATTPIIMSAASTTRSMVKKLEETPHRRSLLKIQIPSRQETESPLAIAVPATSAIPDTPAPAPTPDTMPQSTVTTIEQLLNADPERYSTRKMVLPRHDPDNEASIEAAQHRARHAIFHHSICRDPNCVIHRFSYENK